MKIEITNIEKDTNEGVVMLSMLVGEEKKKYKAQVQKQGDISAWQLEEELFFLLSDFGIQNLCNSAYYQFQTGKIIDRFLSNETLPPFPIDITKTEYGIKKPNRLKIMKGRVWRILHGYHPNRDKNMHNQRVDLTR